MFELMLVTFVVFTIGITIFLLRFISGVDYQKEKKL